MSTTKGVKRITIGSRRFLDPDQRAAEPGRGESALGAFGAEVKDIDLAKRSVRAVMSSRSIDRYGEIVEPSSAKELLPRFLSNPVMLKDHEHWNPIGHWEGVEVLKDTIEGTAVFPEGNKKAEDRWALVKAGSMKAFSIGFRAHEWEMREEDGKDRIRVFTKIELFECSSVAVPANPDAVVKNDTAPELTDERIVRAFIEASKNPDVAKALQVPLTDQLEQLHTLQQQLKQLLSAEPGGQLCTLFQDIVELAMASGPRGSKRDVQRSDDTVSPETAGLVAQLGARFGSG